jgi:hypothetical protein
MLSEQKILPRPLVRLVAAVACAIHAAGDANSAVTVARAASVPSCTSYVDAASPVGNGTVAKPHKTIVAAVEAAAPGAIICVAEGVYPEQIAPGEKYFTIAGGFQSGKNFKVRDSAKYVSKAQGAGGSFLRIEDPGPKAGQLTAIDGFEIVGYSQGIVRRFYEAQRFDITNNFIHDNTCSDESLAGGGFALENVSGAISGNVIMRNSCGRGGAGFLNDAVNNNTVSIANNLIDGNSGTETDSAHGGGFYLFGNKLQLTDNIFSNNTVTQWGAGLYIGAFTQGNQTTAATLSGNIYRSNWAGNSGGGFFCDDGASCVATNEIYDSNCGGNILVDGGSAGSAPTITKFDHITNVNARDVDCKSPGDGVLIGNNEVIAPDSHTFSNAIFWGNAEGRDFVTACNNDCSQLKVSVSNSMVQTKYADGSIKIAFGPNNLLPADPLFFSPDKGDFRLNAASPVIGKGEPNGSDLGAKISSSGLGSEPDERAPKSGALLQTSPSPTISITVKTDDISVKQAFDDARQLGTVAAWKAFLGSYPAGFYANLARAYLTKLGDESSAPAAAKPRDAEAQPSSIDPSSTKQDSASTAPAARQISLGPNVSLESSQLLPDDSPWRQDISKAKIDANSDKILARIGLDKPLRTDFGPEWEGAPVGIPYVVVGADQKKVPVTFAYADESDAGPYPIPADAPIEGGPKGEGDRHILVFDRDAWQLWELFNAFPDNNGGWKADSGAHWDLKKNVVRPAGWTSADAAGLPILPGLVRYDEVVEKKALGHALRFTLKQSRRAYVSPASHWASKLYDEDLPPMGMRVRLKADFDTSSFGPEAQVILEALKKYGMILADNGSDNFISGAPDQRWNVDALRQLMRVTTKDLEVLEMTGMVIDKPK